MNKAVLVLLTFFCLTASYAKADYPQTELRSKTDSVSYFFGALFAEQILPDGEFFRQTFDIEIFLAGLRDGLYENLMDVDFSGLDVEDYISDRYERYEQEKAYERDIEEINMMAEDGFSRFREDAYFKVIRQGTGTQATQDYQKVLFHVTTYDEDGNVLQTTHENDYPEEADAENMFDFFGEKIKPYLSEGAVLRIRSRSWSYDYEEDDEDYIQLYDNVEFEIITVADPS